MDSSTPGFPVHHQLPELTQTAKAHPAKSEFQVKFKLKTKHFLVWVCPKYCIRYSFFFSPFIFISRRLTALQYCSGFPYIDVNQTWIYMCSPSRSPLPPPSPLHPSVSDILVLKYYYLSVLKLKTHSLYQYNYLSVPSIALNILNVFTVYLKFKFHRARCVFSEDSSLLSSLHPIPEFKLLEDRNLEHC